VETNKTGMVNISNKPVVHREAIAMGKIFLNSKSFASIVEKTNPKGDVLENAKLSAINAVKKTPELIFMCHPIPIENVKVWFELSQKELSVTIYVKVVADWKTGVEMEALTGVSAGLLSIWDVCKRYEKDETGNYPNTHIEEIRVVEKKKQL